MSREKDDYREYMFAVLSDSERLVLQHKLFKPRFVSIVEQVLNEYGLAARLETAKTNGLAGQVLDFGCGEGLDLQLLAGMLERRGLLKSAKLNGIDINVSAVATAEKFCKVSNPPRPYLNFYLHDGTQPLEECLGLKLDNPNLKFDFIFAMSVMAHLSDATRHITRLYRALRPGGVLYLRDFVLEEGPNGWIAPHPAITRVLQAISEAMAKRNPESMIALKAAPLLRQLGAVQVQALPDTIPSGGESERGMLLLRNSIRTLLQTGPELVARGEITKAYFDGQVEDLYKQLTREIAGQATYMDTLARKPQTTPLQTEK